MNKIISIAIFTLFLGNLSFAIDRAWVGGNGNGANRNKWDNPLNWNPTGMPTIADNVTIPVRTFQPGLYSTGAVCANLTVNSGATLSINNFELTVDGNATINGNVTYGTGRINITEAFTRNNISGTGIKQLLSQNNYINISTAGITSITLLAFPNQYPPNTPVSFDSTKAIRRYYKILSITGTGYASVRLDYLASEIGSGFSPTNGNVWRYSGSGPWLNEGQILNGNYFAETLSPLAAADLIGDYSIADANSALPIQLASFSGEYLNGTTIELRWYTISEINNYGFYVDKLNKALNLFETIESSFQAGTTNNADLGATYGWVDMNVSGFEETYRLKQVDTDGAEYFHGPIVVSMNPNGIIDNRTSPLSFHLYQNFPNPFNPSTTITFSVGKSGYTTVRVYAMCN